MTSYHALLEKITLNLRNNDGFDSSDFGGLITDNYGEMLIYISHDEYWSVRFSVLYDHRLFYDIISKQAIKQAMIAG